jgi:hypothetical protein
LSDALSASRTRILGLKALPACEPALSPEQARASCDPARAALKALHAASERTASHDEMLERTADAWLAAERALEVLRRASIGEWFETRPQASASASAAQTPHASARPPGTLRTQPSSVRPSETTGILPRQAAEGTPRALPSAAGGHAHAHAQVPARVHDDPNSRLIDEYQRLEALTRRTLATYLQFAPVDLRARAFAELERLCRERPHAPKLRDLVRETTLVESDPALRRKLVALRERLGPG